MPLPSIFAFSYSNGRMSRLIVKLIQALSIALKPDYFSDLNLHANAVIDEAALATIALLPSPLHGGSLPIQQLEPPTHPLPLERLFQAIERISYYPAEKTTYQFIPLVVATASRVIEFKIKIKNDVKELCKSRIWSDGKFAACMQRLMLLGRTWWDAEGEEGRSALGAYLVHTVQSLMILAINRGVAGCSTALSNILPITQGSLTEAFEIYAHPRHL